MAGICLRKRILSAALIITILLTLAACSDKTDVRGEEYEMKRAELQLEKQRYIDERYALRMGLDEYTGHHSYMSFVFVSLDSALYTEIFPLFHDNDQPLKGVMALSLDELPDMDGNVTMEEYDELSMLGWESAVYWTGPVADDGESVSDEDATSQLSSYLTELESELEAIGIDMPASIVMPCRVSEGAYEATLETFGIENILHDYENRDDLVSGDKPEGVWHSGVLGWRDLTRSTRIKRTIEAGGGYASFMITFDNSPENYDTSFFAIDGESTVNGERRVVFSRMLDKFRDSIKYDQIGVVGISEARDKIDAYHDIKDGYLTYSELRTEELNALIEDVDRRLFALYQEYYG